MKSFAFIGGLLAALCALPTAAQAHVKWFAPYIVEASPQPIMQTLTNSWFWSGLVLVLVFFMVTLAVEKSSFGNRALDLLDHGTNRLWARLDDFIRVVIGAFFVAIFAVGGIFLTPDLQTSWEWVSWSQLLIAALIFSRRTQHLAAAGIIGLWLLALIDYPLFHMLDYLALGVGVAAYLVLESSSKDELRRHRYTVLRVGVAIALMWSSLEKFAYPDWFYPLVDERPYLTFGIARDAFIPMAGLAEFTMGFGLLWTPLIRRLSAIALFVIFTAAVYPFGRIDLVGHALIMAIIVAIVADHSRIIGAWPRIKTSLLGVPAGLGAALLVFFGAYWGLHLAIYGPNSVGKPNMPISTHSFDPDHPHATPDNPRGHIGAYEKAMDAMHAPMMQGIAHENPDAAFALGMLPHHVGAVDMAKIQLRYGQDPAMRELAQRILDAQKGEIDEMQHWLDDHGYSLPSAPKTGHGHH